MNPLDQLRDLHLPPAPGGWPPAPGWWLLGSALIFLLCLGYWWKRRQSHANRYRIAARAALQQLHGRPGEALQVTQLLALVRRTARAAEPASPWPTLSASQLVQRLDSACHGRLASELAAAGADLDEVVASQYRPATGTSPRYGEILASHIDWWIRHHRRRELC